jgi:hypothetical protein
MSKYEQMSAAAEKGRKDFYKFRDRSWNSLSKLVQGFVSYCEIPPGQITFLKWNGERDDLRGYTEAEDGRKWTFLGAIDFDEEDGFWHVGVCITLSKPGHFPQDWASYVFCVTESKGKTLVKIGLIGKPQAIDLSDQMTCGVLYQSVVDHILERVTEPLPTPKAKGIGFEVARYNQAVDKKDEAITEK